MSSQTTTEKYVDPGNLVVTVFINNLPLENSLIDLGEATNRMTLKHFTQLGHCTLFPTPMVLELDDRLKMKLEGILECVTISVYSW
jgi:hypothetical protein